MSMIESVGLAPNYIRKYLNYKLMVFSHCVLTLCMCSLRLLLGCCFGQLSFRLCYGIKLLLFWIFDSIRFSEWTIFFSLQYFRRNFCESSSKPDPKTYTISNYKMRKNSLSKKKWVTRAKRPMAADIEQKKSTQETSQCSTHIAHCLFCKRKKPQWMSAYTL